MKAAVLKEFGKPLVIEQVPDPVINSDEVLINVMACGIDGTDLKLLDGFGYTPDLPHVMGHEPSGVVAEIGSDVTDLKPGDHVITYNFSYCGRCRACRAGRQQICPNMTNVLGVRGAFGGYAEYLKMPARQVVRVPHGAAWEDAAVLCDAGITAFHAVDRSRLKVGETVVIFGVGGVGSFAVQFARLAGARVIAVDVSPAKLQHARSLGADETIDITSEDVPGRVAALTDDWGADCAIDIVGKEQTIAAGIDSLCHGGRIVIVGYTPEQYPLNGKQLAQNELEVIGTRCGPMNDLLRAAEVVASGRTRSIVTDTAPLDQVNEALARLREGKVLGRLVLQMPGRA